MVTTPFDSTFNRGRSCSHEAGGACAIAQKSGTSPVQIWFSVTEDMVSWRDPVVAFAYSGTNRNFVVQQEIATFSSLIKITNLGDATYVSWNDGETFAAL